VGKHRQVYDILFQSAQLAFNALDVHGERDLMQQYASVLECLLRLRQACCAASLVTERRLQRAQEILDFLGVNSSGSSGHISQESVKPLSVEEAKQLLNKLSKDREEEDECAVCLQELDLAEKRVLRACGHCFCSECLVRILETASEGERAAVCPLCRQAFKKHDIFSEAETAAASNSSGNAQETQELQEQSHDEESPETLLRDLPMPSKVAAMLADFHAARAEDPSVKAVLFSHFVGCLDVVERALGAEDISYSRLDGRVKRADRQKVLDEFDDPSGSQVMLISTKVGGFGLNLIAASRVYMMDLWWNGAVDEQAMDRVHRIGQKKPVTVIRYLCSDTIEQRILEMQERKEWLGKAALQRMQPHEIRRRRVAQLRSLFGTTDWQRTSPRQAFGGFGLQSGITTGVGGDEEFIND